MKDSLELIIKDIYTLDPSLVEQDGEVRALVSALSEHKPEVKIDAAFVQSLRADLLKAAPIMPAIATKSTPSPWWMVYGAPVGVLALLLLMLVPKATPVVEKEVPVEVPAPAMETNMYEAADPAADMKRSAPAEPESATMMMEADTMMMTTAPMSGDTFQVGTQLAGEMVSVDFVSLTEPSFLVIQTATPEGPGEVLGVSPLLAAGDAQLLEIKLTVTMEPDLTYYAVVYRDDGDGLFALEADTIVNDQSGAPLLQLYSTTPNALPQ